MKNRAIVLPVILAGLLIAAACGKEQPAKNLNDPNCIIGNEDKAKAGRIIGTFQAITNKAKMITVGIKSDSEVISFDDSTAWTWSEEVKSVDDLKKKKGCILIDFRTDGEKKTATAVEVLPPVKVPAEWLIDNAALKGLMKGVPSTNSDLTIVDSRPGPKYAEGSIPGAISIPLPEMKSGAGLERLPKDKNSLIVFYCGGFHCKLAPSSAMIASKKGYTNIKVYHAGYPDWIKSKNTGAVQSSMILSYQKNALPMIIIDIRAAAKDDHIPGAVAININNISQYASQFPAGEDKARAPFIIYGGNADEKAAYELAGRIVSLGYGNVGVLNGGIEAYRKAGGKTVSGQLLTKINYVHKNPPGFISAVDFMKEIEKAIPEDVVFIDVRETGEVSEDPSMTLLGAMNIPLGQLENRASTLDKSKKYYTFCATGLRASMGRDMLAKKGLKAYYVSAKIEGDGESGIAMDEKLKITPDMISKLRAARLSGLGK